MRYVLGMEVKGYEVIYADPPWTYENGGPRGGVDEQYQTMSMEGLKDFGERLKEVTSKDAILFLWAVSPLLPEALQLMESWGFQYKSSAIWDKMTMGIGYWFRGQHEFLLVGTRGKVTPPPPHLRIASVFKSKREEHSKKPSYLRSIISEWYPEVRKLELFARRSEHGLFVDEIWDVFGNEIKESITL